MIAAFFARYWIGLAIGLALVLTAFGAGWQVRAWRCDAALLAVAEANARATARMQDEANAASTEYEQDRSNGYAASQDRQERVRIIYRDRPVSGDCAVPDDARRVLDEAVRAANSGATGQPGR